MAALAHEPDAAILALLEPLDAQLLDPGLKSRALHSESSGGTSGSADYPVCILESALDMFPFSFSKRAAGAICRDGRRQSQFSERRLEFRAGRKNDGALDEIFELAYIAGPMIFRQ